MVHLKIPWKRRYHFGEASILGSMLVFWGGIHIWVVVTQTLFDFHPEKLGKESNLTSIFFRRAETTNYIDNPQPIIYQGIIPSNSPNNSLIIYHHFQWISLQLPSRHPGPGARTEATWAALKIVSKELLDVTPKSMHLGVFDHEKVVENFQPYIIWFYGGGYIIAVCFEGVARFFLFRGLKVWCYFSNILDFPGVGCLYLFPSELPRFAFSGFTDFFVCCIVDSQWQFLFLPTKACFLNFMSPVIQGL